MSHLTSDRSSKVDQSDNSSISSHLKWQKVFRLTRTKRIFLSLVDEFYYDFVLYITVTGSNF